MSMMMMMTVMVRNIRNSTTVIVTFIRQSASTVSSYTTSDQMCEAFSMRKTDLDSLDFVVNEIVSH